MGHEGIGTIGFKDDKQPQVIQTPELPQSYLDPQRRQLFEVALSADALNRGELSTAEEEKLLARLSSMHLHQ